MAKPKAPKSVFKSLWVAELSNPAPEIDVFRKLADNYPARECKFQETKHFGFGGFEERRDSPEYRVLPLDGNRVYFAEIIKHARNVPNPVVQRETRKRARKIEQDNGGEPLDRGAMKDLKRQVYEELLGKAISNEKAIPVLVDREANQLWIGASSKGAIDDALKLMRLGGLDVSHQNIFEDRQLPVWFNGWLFSNTPLPHGLGIGSEMKVIDPHEIKPSVAVKNEELEQPELLEIAKTRMITEFGLASKGVSFVLTHDAFMKKIAFAARPEDDESAANGFDRVHEYRLQTLELADTIKAITSTVANSDID